MPDGDWGGAASGAASGAATGAMVGSVVPGWGTAIGAGVGGIVGGALGYFGSGDNEVDPNKSRFENRAALESYFRSGLGEGYRQAPSVAKTRLGQVALGQAAQLDPAQQAQFREQQMAQANRLGQIASGQMQGAGELASQRQAARAVAQQQAMARMGRGMSGASAARGAARNVAGIGAAAAGQSQLAALQDQQAANAQLGGLLAQGRGADIGLAGQNAQLAQQRMLQQGTMDQQTMLQQGGMDQQTALSNMNARLQMMGMDDARRNALLQQWMSMNQAEMAGRLGQEQVAMSQPGIQGPLLQAAGQIGAAYASSGGGQAASDARAKKNVKHGGADIDEMLDALKATSYEYKEGVPEKYVGPLGDGRRIAGFLAQDLEKSKAGKAIVSDSPEGIKVVDVKGATFAALAASARLNERLRALEAKKG